MCPEHQGGKWLEVGRGARGRVGHLTWPGSWCIMLWICWELVLELLSSFMIHAGHSFLWKLSLSTAYPFLKSHDIVFHLVPLVQMMGWFNIELRDLGQSPKLSEPHIPAQHHGGREMIHSHKLGKDMSGAESCPTQGLAPVE